MIEANQSYQRQVARPSRDGDVRSQEGHQAENPKLGPPARAIEGTAKALAIERQNEEDIQRMAEGLANNLTS